MKGLTVFDAEVSSAPSNFEVHFVPVDDGKLRMVLSSRGTYLAGVVVPPPSEHWDFVGEISKAQSAAEMLLRKLPERPRPAWSGNDLSRAKIAFDSGDLFATVFGINMIGDAARDRRPTGEALRAMAFGYAWLGRWTRNFPTARGKSFEARALAYAALADRIEPAGQDEMAFALVQAGREADGLELLAISTPVARDVAALSWAMGKRDASYVGSSSGTPLGLYALNWIEGRRGGISRYRETARKLAVENPSNVVALRRLIAVEDVGPKKGLTQAYLYIATTWEPYLDLVAGKRLVPSDAEMPIGAVSAETFLARLEAMGEGDPAQEVPLPLRVEIAKDVALDAALSRLHFLVWELSSPEAADAFRAEMAPLSRGHPLGGLLVGMKRDFSSEQASVDAVGRALAQARISYGLVERFRVSFPYSGPVSLGDWLRSRRDELEDLSLDRGEISGADFDADGRRAVELSPHDAKFWKLVIGSGGDRQQIAQAMVQTNGAPAILWLAVNAIQGRVPVDLAQLNQMLDLIIADDPLNSATYTEKASVLAANGEFEKAIAVWRSFLAAGDTTSLEAAHAVAGMVWANRVIGRPWVARRLAWAAAQSYSQTSLLNLAYALEDCGRLDVAEEILGRVQHRYGPDTEWDRIRFYARTGDPRGLRELKAYIPRFMSNANNPTFMTDEAHLRLLESFMATGEWADANDLINQVLIGRWHKDDPAFYLLMAVSSWKEGSGLPDSLPGLRAMMEAGPHQTDLDPVANVFLGRGSVDSAAASLKRDPGVRAVGYYLLGQYAALKQRDSALARKYFERTVGLRQYGLMVHFLALQELKLVPSYPSRIATTWRAILQDLFEMRANFARLGRRAHAAR